ncbi:MAG: metal-dependent hydrolase [Planctomycetota bacterium]
MLDNAPIKSMQHDGFTIEGYSRAAVQSYWRIPELKLGFDLGAHPWDFMGTSTWLISHCHLDHIAALPLYVARRRLMKMAKPKIYLPAFAVEPVRKMLATFERLDRGRMHCDLIGVEGGDEIELSRELVLNVCKTKHTVPSVGFVVSERRRKLKPEYHGLAGDKIRDIRQSGTEVTEELRFPLVGYTGDTSPEGLDQNPIFYTTKILITEMTFVAADHQSHLIHKNGHMHLDDFVKRQDQFQNELVVAGHFSTRYSRHQAIKIVKKRLPDLLNGRLQIWL